MNKSKDMRERAANEQDYPFYWLDEVIEVILNPERTNLKELKTEQLEQIKARLPIEINTIIHRIKSQAFSLYCIDQVKVVAGHYDLSVRVLQKQAQSNLENYPKSGPLYKTGQLIRAGLEELSNSLHHRYSTYLPTVTPDDKEENPTFQNLLTKVLCAFSADQLGIILRAAFDVKLIIGNSFRKVCKAIAPYLSTPWKKEISWDSVRSNSGRPEKRDLDIVIQTLEKMIEKIKGYR